MSFPQLTSDIKKRLHQGVVIPAHPLALTRELKLDERRQRALTRYYLAAGAGGLAVGVHTTQFEIREEEIGLLEPVLALARDEVKAAGKEKEMIMVAGICGPTDQAVAEAKLARNAGYDLGLLSMGGLGDWTEKQLIERAEKVAREIPLFGFYLQPAVGGRVLSYEFWKSFAEIPNVSAIKVAAFNRYQTLDVVRAVAGSKRSDDIALYTGNDDNIVADLLTPYRFTINGKVIEKRFTGGLLGHWAVWTSKAVELLDRIKNIDGEIPEDLLTHNIEVTDSNAVLFDAANDFKGCIPGIHEVLRRQGLLDGTWCLNRDEVLSDGQTEEIDRIYEQYPHLTDDDFISSRLDQFLD